MRLQKFERLSLQELMEEDELIAADAARASYRHSKAPYDDFVYSDIDNAPIDEASEDNSHDEDVEDTSNDEEQQEEQEEEDQETEEEQDSGSETDSEGSDNELETTSSAAASDSENNSNDEDVPNHKSAAATIDKYLCDNSGVYRKLKWERVQGWRSPEASDYFAEKKRRAKQSPEDTIARLQQKMMKVAKRIQVSTGAFTIDSDIERKRILDLSVVPGTFLTYALEENPEAHALAFSLPVRQGGFAPALDESESVRIQVLDMTMLAADMGVGADDFVTWERDAEGFRLSQYFDDGPGSGFDLVICDNVIEPTRAMFYGCPENRRREERRRLLSQLILGLQHLRDGGKMIVELQKLENIQTIQIILEFCEFSTVAILRKGCWAGKLEGFYLIATNVRSTSRKAWDAVKLWKWEWKVVTLGSRRDWLEDRDRQARCIREAVEDFRPRLLELGEGIWKTHADLLANAPWKQKNKPTR